MVAIRMMKMGRKHRHYFRIVAIDSRQPRDGRFIEELGSYDPHILETDQRTKLKPERIKHWLSVGAQPSDKCRVLFKKYMAKAEQEAAAGSQQPATSDQPEPATA